MFYIKPVEGVRYSAYEMTNSLSRYLIGNRFIEHIAFYRLAEPDTIYTSNGQLTFHMFWTSYLNSENFTESGFLDYIRTQNGVKFIRMLGGESGGCFMYVCPLPQFPVNPLSFVMAIIPTEELSEPMSALLASDAGQIAIYDARGDEIYSVSTIGDYPNLFDEMPQDGGKFTRKAGGDTYMVQSASSAANNWTYVSAVQLNNVFKEMSGGKVLLILRPIVLMIAAVFMVLAGIIKKYRPISNLTMTLTDTDSESGAWWMKRRCCPAP